MTTAWESAVSLLVFVFLVFVFLVDYSFQLVGAIPVMGVMGIGVLVANRVHRLALSVQERRKVDLTLRQLLAAVARSVVLVGFAIMAVGRIGLNIGPFPAAIGGLALGASFALQLPVSNYGAGLVIILIRPLRMGDTIRVVDQWGIVEDINLAMTHLTDEDGEEIFMPDKHLIGEVLINSRSNRIVEGVVQVSCGDVPQRAAEVVRSALDSEPDVSATPAFQVGIRGFADSGIKIGYRYWVPARHFFELR